MLTRQMIRILKILGQEGTGMTPGMIEERTHISYASIEAYLLKAWREKLVVRADNSFRGKGTTDRNKFVYNINPKIPDEVKKIILA